MARFALAAFLKCAREMKDHGAFTYVREMAPIKEVQGGVQVTGLTPSFRGERSDATRNRDSTDRRFASSANASLARNDDGRNHPSLNPYSGTLPLAP